MSRLSDIDLEARVLSAAMKLAMIEVASEHKPRHVWVDSVQVIGSNAVIEVGYHLGTDEDGTQQFMIIEQNMNKIQLEDD